MALTKSSGDMNNSPSSSCVACCKNLALDSFDTPSGASDPSSDSFNDSFIA